MHGLGFSPDTPPLVTGDVILRGIPRGAEDRVTDVLLEITPEHQIRRIKISAVDGSTTEYRFADQKEDIPLDDARFHFVAPAGVETVEGDMGQ